MAKREMQYLQIVDFFPHHNFLITINPTSKKLAGYFHYFINFYFKKATTI